MVLYIISRYKYLITIFDCPLFSALAAKIRKNILFTSMVNDLCDDGAFRKYRKLNKITPYPNLSWQTKKCDN
jgi:hypothetical protein